MRIGLLMAIAVGVIVYPMVAWACSTMRTDIRLSTATANPGDPTVVYGVAWKTDENPPRPVQATLYWGDTSDRPFSTTPLATRMGPDFNVSLTIPASFVPGTTYRLLAMGVNPATRLSFTKTFDVTMAPSDVPAPTGGDTSGGSNGGGGGQTGGTAGGNGPTGPVASVPGRGTVSTGAGADGPRTAASSNGRSVGRDGATTFDRRVVTENGGPQPATAGTSDGALHGVDPPRSSSRMASGDLWSGFSSKSGSRNVIGLGSPTPRAGGVQFAVGASLLLGGLAALLAIVAVRARGDLKPQRAKIHR